TKVDASSRMRLSGALFDLLPKLGDVAPVRFGVARFDRIGEARVEDLDLTVGEVEPHYGCDMERAAVGRIALARLHQAETADQIEVESVEGRHETGVEIPLLDEPDPTLTVGSRLFQQLHALPPGVFGNNGRTPERERRTTDHLRGKVDLDAGPAAGPFDQPGVFIPEGSKALEVIHTGFGDLVRDGPDQGHRPLV